MWANSKGSLLLGWIEQEGRNWQKRNESRKDCVMNTCDSDYLDVFAGVGGVVEQVGIAIRIRVFKTFHVFQCLAKTENNRPSRT